jgi:ribosomal-protein-alanine N-acetyltransferase
MSFFRPYSFSDVLPPLQGDGIILRAPEMDHYDEWAALRARSRSFLEPWEPVWAADELTRGSFRARMRRYARDVRSDNSYPFFIFRRSDGALVGGLTLGQVRRGVSQTAALGYWMGQPYAGQGLMTEAVRTVAPLAFGTLGLHRIEAACLPENAASIRLLEKVGFRREGEARAYLCIAGAWRDHVLFALLASDLARRSSL